MMQNIILDNKNILVISGVPFRNDTNLGKTLCTLFSKVPKENLVQIYFSPLKPNVDVCKTYYQIDERQLLKSIFGLQRKKCGKIYKGGIDDKGLSVKQAYKVAHIKDNTSLIMARDIIWKLYNWKNKCLKCWLDDFSPEAIFFILPDNVKNAKFAKWVSERYNAPVVLFVTDDYYHDNGSNKSLYIRNRYKKLQKAVLNLGPRISKVVGCSKMASEEFGSILNAPFETILTPADKRFLAFPLKEQSPEGEVVLRYFGNLGLNRWLILEKIGHALSNLRKKGCKAHLEIFSNISDEERIKRLNIDDACFYKGWIQGEDFDKALQSTDIAIHVESFDEYMCKRTRLSVSTKIADYLGAGKCILAVGPLELASIQHLQDVACTISDLNNCESIIENLIKSPERRIKMQVESRNKAVAEHNIECIPVDLSRILNISSI